MDNSLIFKTIESDVNKSGLALQLFKKNLSDIKNDFGNAKGIGGKLNSIFSSGLTDNDVKRIKEYNHLIEKGQNPQSAYYRALKNSSAAAQNLAQSAKGATVSQKSMDTALKATSASSKAAAVGMKALSVAGNMIVGIGIGIAINGLITLFDNLINYQKKLVESANKLSEEYKQLQSDISSLQEKLKANQDKINEINKNPLDIVGENTLQTLQLENIELERQLELAKQLAKERGKDAGEAAYKALLSKDTGYGEVRRSELFGSSRKQGTYGEAAQYNIDKIKELNNEILSLDNTSKKYEKSKADLERQIGYENDELIKNVENIGNLRTQLDLTNPSQKELYDNLTAIQDSYHTLQTLSPDLNTFEEIFETKATSEQKQKLFELAQQGELTAQSFKDNYGMLTILFESIGLSIDDVVTKIVGLSQVSTNQTSILSFALDDISNELASFNDGIAKVYSSMDLLDKAADEFANSGMISAEIFKSLSDNNLLQYLQFTSDGLSILTDDLLNNEQATKQKAQADLAAALYADLLALATNNVATAETNATGATNSAGSAAETMGQRFARSATGILTAAQALDMFNSVANGGKGGFDFKGQEQQFNKLIGNYNSAVGAIQNMGSKSDSTANSFNRMGSSAKSAADEMKRAMSSAQSAIQSLLSMTMNMLKQQYNDQKKNIQNQLDALSKRYNAEKTHLDNIAKAKKKQYDDEKKALQDELEGYRKKVNAQLELLRAKENERDYQNELLEKQKEVSDLEADLAVKGLDTSEEGIRRRLELEAQVAEKRKELDEFQHDKSIEDQENALNKELSDFEEKTNNKLDILDKESTRYEEMHQNRLDDIDEEYERKRERLEAQQKNIEEKVSNEAFIRSEAIKLIEDKNSGLYQKLLEWNRRYSSGVDADVTNAWNNAYSAMDQFNGAQMGVLGVLNDLALKMNDFQSATQNAASAMQGLTNAIKDKNNAEKNAIPSDWRQQLANAGGLSGTQFGKSKGFKIGGKITKNRALATNVDNEPDAVLIKAHTDEVILPKDNPRRALDLMAEFINSDVPLSNMINRGSSNNLIDIASVVNPMSNLGTSNLQNYERVNNSTGDIKIDYKFDVSGNLDNNTIPPLKKLLELASEKTINDILRQRQKSGKTRDMKSYSL